MLGIFFKLLPFYLLGNFHCMSMCGPLMFALKENPKRNWYFLGRILSYTLVGTLAALLGKTVLDISSDKYMRAGVSFAFGVFILFLGLLTYFKMQLPGRKLYDAMFQKVSNRLAFLMLQQRVLPTFLFGFFTVLLPCGQTLMVFSLLASEGNVSAGVFNGFAFALLTTPSLLLSSAMIQRFPLTKSYVKPLMSVLTVFVASLAFLRGFAELGLISHKGMHFMKPFHFMLMLY